MTTAPVSIRERKLYPFIETQIEELFVTKGTLSIVLDVTLDEALHTTKLFAFSPKETTGGQASFTATAVFS